MTDKELIKLLIDYIVRIREQNTRTSMDLDISFLCKEALEIAKENEGFDELATIEKSRKIAQSLNIAIDALSLMNLDFFKLCDNSSSEDGKDSYYACKNYANLTLKKIKDVLNERQIIGD